MRTPAILGIGLAGLVAAAACGVDEDLFREGGGPLPTATGGTTTTTTGSGTATGAGTSAGTPAGSSAGTSTGAGTGAGTGTGSGTGTGTGGGNAEIPCGVATCIGGQICCVSLQSAALDTCGHPGTCGDEAIEAACDGPDDCPGTQICCGRFVSTGTTGHYVEVACAPTCEDDGGSLGVVMCESEADCGGGPCVPSNWLPPGFSYCD